MVVPSHRNLPALNAGGRRLRMLVPAGAAIALLASCTNLDPPPEAGGGAGPSAGSGSDSPESGAGGSVAGGGTAGSALQAGQGPGGAGEAGHLSGGSGGQSSQAGGAGKSSTAGSGGSAGSAATGGSAGGCPSPTTGNVHAWLRQEVTDPQPYELHPFFALTNSALPDVPLSGLSVRYYFTGEMNDSWEPPVCFWVTQHAGTNMGLCSKATLKVFPLIPKRVGADHYLEIAFPGMGASDVLAKMPQDTFEVRSKLWAVGTPQLDTTNDYSFAPTSSNALVASGSGFSYSETTKVTVYRNGQLIWGREPCP